MDTIIEFKEAPNPLFLEIKYKERWIFSVSYTHARDSDSVSNVDLGMRKPRLAVQDFTRFDYNPEEIKEILFVRSAIEVWCLGFESYNALKESPEVKAGKLDLKVCWLYPSAKELRDRCIVCGV